MRSRHAAPPDLFWTSIVIVLLATAARGAQIDVICYMMSTVHISYIHHDTKWPACRMALEDFQNEGGLEGHEVRVHYVNDSCTRPYAYHNVFAAIEKDPIKAIVGSFCSTTTEDLSHMIRYWDIPIFPCVSTSPELADKDYYNNVIRVAPVTTTMGPAFVDILNYYNWKRIIVLASLNNFCSYGVTTFQRNIIGTDITVPQYIRVPEFRTDAGDFGSSKIPIETIDYYLRTIRQRARIVLFCLEATPDIISFMMRAHVHGMTGGDYVFINFALVPSSYDIIPWDLYLPANISDEQYQERREAFYPYKLVTVADLSGPKIDAFLTTVHERSVEPPYYFEVEPDGTASLYAAFLYDAMKLFLIILNETLAAGIGDPTSEILFDKARNRSFNGQTGQVVLDDKADRDPAYWLYFCGPDSEEMTPGLLVHTSFTESQHRVEEIGPGIYWGTENNEVPLDIPVCGFENELCPVDSDVDTIIASSVTCGIILIICTAGVLFYHRKQMLEKELQQMLWKVDFAEVTKLSSRLASRASLSLRSVRSATSSISLGSQNSELGIRTDVTVCLYRGQKVVLRKINKERVTFDRDELLLLKQLWELNHANLNAFVGACIDPPNICILTNFCQKGTLQDILGNDDINLDWMFKCSLLSDLTDGMRYLHSSPVKFHGALKSSKCLVDNRWQLKISGARLQMLKQGEVLDEEVGEHAEYREMLWTAPEMLRMSDEDADAGRMMLQGGAKADVYSFAIIVQEVLYRAPPFFTDTLSPKELVELIKNYPYRPDLPALKSDAETRMGDVMRECWEEDPQRRLSFPEIMKRLIIINNGQQFNIVENMLIKLERYASNLEGLVAQRTGELEAEKKKTDQLLYKMLPWSVAEDLKRGTPVCAEIFDLVTIFFSDVYGFQSLSSSSTPVEMVDFLNDLYIMMDDIIALHDVYKVETIGDAYMCCSGLPRRNGDRHVAEIANMALDLLSDVTHIFCIRHRPDMRAQLRIGMHTGSCAAGVVGLTMPRYCLFGDTVNMASRMESNGLPLKIHMSTDAYEALAEYKEYHLRSRGQMQIKGKGLQTTYFLCGKDGFNKPLPSDDDDLL